MYQQIHINDRKAIADQINLSLEEFDALVKSANHAYEFLKIMGPFYGQESVQEPTFRTTAEPVRLPIGSKKLFSELGNDIVHLGKALPKLPHQYKKMLGGSDIDFRLPLSFRLDAILDESGKIWINEIEGSDGASALMMIEQLAYGLQKLEDTTVWRMVNLLHKMFPQTTSGSPLKLAVLRSDIQTSPYTANIRRFMELMDEVSQGTVACELFDVADLQTRTITPDWEKYQVVFNETFISPSTIYSFGIRPEQLFATANYHALVNKGVFALLHEPALKSFWQKEIGENRYTNLCSALIPSAFITTKDELQAAKDNNDVAKLTWVENDIVLINRSYGVAIPTGDIVQSSQERWTFLEECLAKGDTLISQKFIPSAKLHAYLRKKGVSLEPVAWHHRICVKYVMENDPNQAETPESHVTATEVTLGPDLIPAGRKCAFTAGILA